MSKLPFGKHRGKDIDDVPSDYLLWLVQQDRFEEEHPNLLKEVEEELGYRDEWNKHFYEDR